MARKVSKNKTGAVIIFSIGLLTALYFGLDNNYLPVPLASYPSGTNFSALGFSEVDGLTIKDGNNGYCVGGGSANVTPMCQFLCLKCNVPPEASALISKEGSCNRNCGADGVNKHYSGGNMYFDIDNERLRELRIINDQNEYVPYDSEGWIDQFPEVKRINPSDTWQNNYYIDTPVFSDYDLQQKINKANDDFEQKLNTVNTEITDIKEQNAELEKLIAEYENDVVVYDIEDEKAMAVIVDAEIATASYFDISQEFLEYVFTGDFDALNDSKFFTLYAVLLGGSLVLSIISSRSRQVVYYGWW